MRCIVLLRRRLPRVESAALGLGRSARSRSRTIPPLKGYPLSRGRPVLRALTFLASPPALPSVPRVLMAVSRLLKPITRVCYLRSSWSGGN
ncbi:hypothetical protein H4582DRAFT_1962906 [Lactarius indigo]|nr:hypothetical protein H4582DRAFT_1962906 [Lactarius indigo]